MPTVIAGTWPFATIGTEVAYPMLTEGRSALDAVEAAASAVEKDESVDTVGYGGLPDRAGQVTLDAAVMTDPAHCGAVAGVTGYTAVTTLARWVMEKTNHTTLIGRGAEAFAKHHGLPETALLTARSKSRWDKLQHQLTAKGIGPYDPILVSANLTEDFQVDPANRFHDTVSYVALDQHGQLAAACSSSGVPLKLPGRVGDSPIFGQGLYVDPRYGAVVCTGTGEVIAGHCTAYQVIAHLRAGRSPQDALKASLDDIATFTKLEPHHQIGVILMTPTGQVHSAALRPGFACVTAGVDETATRDPGYVVDSTAAE